MNGSGPLVNISLLPPGSMCTHRLHDEVDDAVDEDVGDGAADAERDDRCRSAVSGARRGAPETTSCLRHRRRRRQGGRVVGSRSRATLGRRAGKRHERHVTPQALPFWRGTLADAAIGAARGRPVVGRAPVAARPDACCVRSSMRISSSSVFFSSLEARLNSARLLPSDLPSSGACAARNDQRNREDDDQFGDADGAKHNANPWNLDYHDSGEVCYHPIISRRAARRCFRISLRRLHLVCYHQSYAYVAFLPVAVLAVLLSARGSSAARRSPPRTRCRSSIACLRRRSPRSTASMSRTSRPTGSSTTPSAACCRRSIRIRASSIRSSTRRCASGRKGATTASASRSR